MRYLLDWSTWLTAMVAVVLLALVVVAGPTPSSRHPAAGEIALRPVGSVPALEPQPKHPALRPAKPSPQDIIMVPASYDIGSVLNPRAALWSTAPPTSIPLLPQNIVAPHGGGSVKELKVRALRLASGVAFHFQWADATKDNETVHQAKFRDGVAVEFPIDQGADTVLAMGHPNGPVNIWHWKADWEPDAPRMNTGPYDAAETGDPGSIIYGRLHVDSAREPDAAQGKGGPTTGIFNLFPQNAHKSPVENIVAIGISSVTSKPPRYQDLQGRGEWHNGSWQVVVFKPFRSDDPATPSFHSARTVNAAFAVWNGSQGDRNGMKSISNWTQVRVP